MGRCKGGEGGGREGISGKVKVREGKVEVGRA